MLLDLIAFHRSGSLDSSTEQKEFFSERCFTGIRVGNDRKCAALMDFVTVLHNWEPQR
jgi:hypothetical protein